MIIHGAFIQAAIAAFAGASFARYSRSFVTPRYGAGHTFVARCKWSAPAKHSGRGAGILLPVHIGDVRYVLRSPVWLVPSLLDALVKAGPLPFAGGLRPAVLYRVVVDVIHVALPVVFVANHVFPKTALPSMLATGGKQEFLRGILFDVSPSGGVIRISFGECPDTVQVVGHQDEGVHGEGAFFFHATEGPAQGVDVEVVRQERLAAVGYHCEEVGAAGDVRASVGGQGLLPCSEFRVSVP